MSQVNPDDLEGHPGIIANPNCSTMQLVPVLMALRDSVGLERVIVDTYQAVSGTGADAIAEFEGQIRAHVAGEPKQATVYPHPIAFNALPQVDVFLDNGYTKEEWKVVSESRKILHLPELRVSCTAVRVPVFVSHSEAVHVETRDPITPERARQLFGAVEGVVVQDDPSSSTYPLASEAAGQRRHLRRACQDGSVDRRRPRARVLGRQRQPPQGRGDERGPDRRSARRARLGPAGRPARRGRVRGRRWRACRGGRWGSSVTHAERAAALEEVAAEVRACTSCRLHQTRTLAVPGEGSPDTEVVFVGEGPGFNEDQQGRPFVGRAGDLLTKFLATLRWKRQEVFITNIVKCRPPDNRDPEPDEIAACAPYLKRQLEILDPALVVTLGRHSLGRFMPGERISQAHGTVRAGRSRDRRAERDGIRALPSSRRASDAGHRAHELRRRRPDPGRAPRSRARRTATNEAPPASAQAAAVVVPPPADAAVQAATAVAVMATIDDAATPSPAPADALPDIEPDFTLF